MGALCALPPLTAKAATGDWSSRRRSSGVTSPSVGKRRHRRNRGRHNWLSNSSTTTSGAAGAFRGRCLAQSVPFAVIDDCVGSRRCSRMRMPVSLNRVVSQRIVSFGLVASASLVARPSELPVGVGLLDGCTGWGGQAGLCTTLRTRPRTSMCTPTGDLPRAELASAGTRGAGLSRERAFLSFRRIAPAAHRHTSALTRPEPPA